LEKQVKAQPSHDNRRNMMNKLEKGKTMPKFAPQQQKGLLITRKKKEQILIRMLNM
jgi:hypothetical protein